MTGSTCRPISRPACRRSFDGPIKDKRSICARTARIERIDRSGARAATLLQEFHGKTHPAIPTWSPQGLMAHADAPGLAKRSDDTICHATSGPAACPVLPGRQSDREGRCGPDLKQRHCHDIDAYLRLGVDARSPALQGSKWPAVATVARDANRFVSHAPAPVRVVDDHNRNAALANGMVHALARANATSPDPCIRLIRTCQVWPGGCPAQRCTVSRRPLSQAKGRRAP